MFQKIDLEGFAYELFIWKKGGEMIKKDWKSDRRLLRIVKKRERENAERDAA